MIKNSEEKISLSKNQWFSQIIFPIVFCLILISIGSFLLVSKSLNLELNLRMLGDISSSLLILLVLPAGLLALAGIITSTFLMHKLIVILRMIFPKFRSVFEKISNGICNACETSARPFFFLGSILTIFDKNKIKD
jgi:hypothetical protein